MQVWDLRLISYVGQSQGSQSGYLTSNPFLLIETICTFDGLSKPAPAEFIWGSLGGGAEAEEKLDEEKLRQKCRTDVED